MQKLLIATHNLHKIEEFRALMADLPVRLTSLAEEGIALDVDETGTTLEENAILKARAYADASGLWAWADDSGLEVDALDGRPGVRSARYAGEAATHADNNAKLLRELSGVPQTERTARFRCVIALASSNAGRAVQTVNGALEGAIAVEPRGAHGFGYDPLFLLPARGVTLAELPPEEKNRISHRAVASAAAKRLVVELLTKQK